MREKDLSVRKLDLPSLPLETPELLLRKGRSGYVMMRVFPQVVRGVRSMTNLLSYALELQIANGTQLRCSLSYLMVL